MNQQLPTQLISDNATLPTYGSEQAAGMDLYADFTSEVGNMFAISPGARALIKTGLSVVIPDTYYGRIAPRSGLAYKYGIDVMAGVIDSDYRGEIGVILINHGGSDFVVKHGDRIAQMIITPYMNLTPTACEELPVTERGGGGFGSTGV